MRNAFVKSARLLPVLALTACATVPTNSYVPVMPGPNKPFEVFQQDQQTCKAYAYQQVSGQAEAANNRGVAAAILGTAIGAGLGAAVAHNAGTGAAVGAVYGAAAGSAIGASGSQQEGYGIQRQYDIAYEQCMYAKGNQVPGFASAGAAPPPPPPDR
jgi:uncharacterized protein YcfJ